MMGSGGGGGGRGSGRARGSTEGSVAASGRRRKSLAQHLKRALSGKGADPTAAQARHILLQAKSRMYSEVEDQEEDSATIDERLAPGSGRRRASNVAGGGSGSDGDGSRRASNVSQASFHTHTKDERKHTIMSGLQAYHDKPMNLHGQYTIITQTLEDIEHLVAALRKPHLAYRPVIIMCPLRDEEQERDEASWAAAAAAFPDVWLLQGHPRNDGDLDRALVHLAHTVVIVAGRQEGRGGEDGAATMDAETILAVVSIIARSQSRVRLVTELATGDHVEHYGVAQRQSLLNLPGVTTRQRRSLLAGAASETEVEGARRPRRVPHQLQEVYAAGGIVLSNLTETLLCQAYFNDHIVAVVSSFLQNHMDRENDGSSIAQIPMPPKFLEGRAPEACTFEALLAHMLDRHDVLTIALYRNSHHARWARSGAGEGARSRQNSFALLGDQLMDTFMRQGSNLSKVFNKKKSHRSSEHERMEQQQKEMDEDEDIVASYVVTCPEPDTLVTANDYIFVFVKDLETYNRITADEKRRTSLRVADGEVVNVNVHTPSNVYKAAQKKSKAAGGLPPRPSPPAAAAAAAAAAAGPAAGPGAAEAPCPGPSARSETGSKGAPGSARVSSVSRPSARVAPILGPGLGAERRPEPSPGAGEGAEMRKSKGDQRHSLDFERMPSAKFNEVLDEVSRSISGSPSASRSSAGGGPCGPNGTLSRHQQKVKPEVGISNSKNTSKPDPLVLSGRSSLVVESVGSAH